MVPAGNTSSVLRLTCTNLRCQQVFMVTERKEELKWANPVVKGWMAEGAKREEDRDSSPSFGSPVFLWRTMAHVCHHGLAKGTQQQWHNVPTLDYVVMRGYAPFQNVPNQKFKMVVFFKCKLNLNKRGHFLIKKLIRDHDCLSMAG